MIITILIWLLIFIVSLTIVDLCYRYKIWYLEQRIKILKAGIEKQKRIIQNLKEGKE